jgi:hypothetical protein
MRFFAYAVAKQARAVSPAPAVGAVPLAITIGTAFDARTITSKALHVAPSGQETIEDDALAPAHAAYQQQLASANTTKLDESRCRIQAQGGDPASPFYAEFTGLRNERHHRKAVRHYGAVEGVRAARNAARPASALRPLCISSPNASDTRTAKHELSHPAPRSAQRAES